jgi:flagellar P-ring protein precursor FlgI
MKRLFLSIILLIVVVALAAQTRVKDISKVGGMDSRQLIGYGIVTGLKGTGDTPASQVTTQSINNLLEHFGLTVPENRIRPNNSAAVMITAEMPPFAAAGTTFDIVISSIGDARSLEGGILLLSPLIGQDNRQYATAQGSVSIGGSNEDTKGTNGRVRTNYTNSGRIPNGASVILENPNVFINNGVLKVLLNQADFTTAERVATAINGIYDMRIATPDNASSISVAVPDNVIMNNNLITFISTLENLVVVPEQTARVVINERTGTIVAGADVRITAVSIAHGNLIVKVVPPLNLGPYSLEMLLDKPPAGEALRIFNLESATVGELALALNSIRVTPRDLISIFQAIKAAGALQAELKIL